MADAIGEAGLADWRKLAQGLHTRFVVEDLASGAAFVGAIADTVGDLGEHLRLSLDRGSVDLRLMSDDAVYREDDGTEHIVQWVTQADVDLARRISEVAAARGLRADPGSVSMVELGLDTGRSGTVAPVWAALLTGDAAAQGHGSPSDEIRDALGRIPNLWFGDAPEEDRQRFHVEVYVPPDVAKARVAAVVAAGGTIVDDSEAPGLTVFEDQDGNRGVLCVAPPHKTSG